MFINTFHYTPEDVDCKLCAQYVKGKGCTEDACPWLAERIEAGVVGYAEAVRDLFPGTERKPYRLNARLHNAISGFSGSFYLDEQHKARMEHLKARDGHSRKDAAARCAVMYLLSADQDLYARTQNCFCRHGIELDYATVRGISARDYALLSAAKSIYSGASGVKLDDLADAKVVDAVAFGLIVNAMLIARYGSAALGIRERSAK